MNLALDNLECQEYEMALVAASQAQTHALKHNREMLLKHRDAVFRYLISIQVKIPPELFKQHRDVGNQVPDRAGVDPKNHLS